VWLTQAMPSSQSASVSHELVHAPVTQRNGWQFWIPPAWQVPRPLQVPGVLRLLPAHVGATHTVSRGNLAQPPSPSHSPV